MLSPNPAKLDVSFNDKPFGEAVAEAQALYAQHGCFLARGIFSADELKPIQRDVSELVKATYKNINRPGPSNPKRFDDGVVELARIDRKLISKIFDAGRRILPVHELSVDKRMIGLSKALMGTELISASDIKALRIDLPSEDKYLFHWHQDYPYVMDSLDAVIFWIPLQDVDETNGALTVALGSHHAGVQKLVLIDPDNKENNKQKMMKMADSDAASKFPQMQVPARLGDALVFNTLLLHASGANTSDRARFTLQVRFGNFLHPKAIEKGWPGSMRDGSIFHALHPEYIAGNEEALEREKDLSPTQR